MKQFVLLALFATVAHAGPFGLPKPELSPLGMELILDGETGGKAYYNRNPHPEWPGGPSGVTWGIGYDATAQSAKLIKQDWEKLRGSDEDRLAATQQYSGQAAKAKLGTVRDILVEWDLAVEVFTEVDLARNWQLCQRTFPGFDSLRPNAQAAILSLVFNRGAALSGPKRKEMRDIRDAVPRKDYRAMADAEISMIRLWVGTDIAAGMRNRRKAEAKLFLTP